MSYITYGPSPTSHYRVVRTPADPVFTSPLDRPDDEGLTSLRRRASAASRTTLAAVAWTAVGLTIAAAALVLRVAIYTAGHGVGLF